MAPSHAATEAVQQAGTAASEAPFSYSSKLMSNDLHFGRVAARIHQRVLQPGAQFSLLLVFPWLHSLMAVHAATPASNRSSLPTPDGRL